MVATCASEAAVGRAGRCPPSPRHASTFPSSSSSSAFWLGDVKTLDVMAEVGSHANVLTSLALLLLLPFVPPPLPSFLLLYARWPGDVKTMVVMAKAGFHATVLTSFGNSFPPSSSCSSSPSPSPSSFFTFGGGPSAGAPQPLLLSIVPSAPRPLRGRTLAGAPPPLLLLRQFGGDPQGGALTAYCRGQFGRGPLWGRPNRFLSMIA